MFVVPESVSKDLLSANDAVQEIESAFLSLERNEAIIFPVAGGNVSAIRAGFSLKSAFMQSPHATALGVKVGTYWKNNPSLGIPCHGSTVLLLDVETGLPHALVGASHLTALRTAAADALAVKYLARNDAHVVGIIGAGHQARFELDAVALQRRVDAVRVWSRSSERANAFARDARDDGYACVATATPEDATRDADIVITVTPAREPLVRSTFLRKGAHVSAMGSDSAGKQELDVDLVASSSLFCDTISQSTTIGEFQHAWKAERITSGSLRTLGSVIAGTSPGRQGDDDITIFDSSGMAIQDVALAVAAVTRALQSDRAIELQW